MKFSIFHTDAYKFLDCLLRNLVDSQLSIRVLTFGELAVGNSTVVFSDNNAY